MPVEIPTRVRELRDSALATSQMQVALLEDLEGLCGAFEGLLYFQNGGEGYSIEGYPEIRLSERAARFCGLT
ncbi:MAG: hypothetical protein F4X03_00500 [Dehalococcoidia bacterium]|nr:hypothetical protein [Dehalococcoidia bacterium]MYD27389.1 hypothetical protein [Dehalococcoidia bacterium]